MDRFFDAIIRFMMHERLLQKFKVEVAKGEATSIDVFLKKETEYIVKAKVLKGFGKPMLSISDVAGLDIQGYSNGMRNPFIVSPERDGVYHICVAVSHTDYIQESSAVEVTLSCVRPPPEYIISEINRLRSRIGY